MTTSAASNNIQSEMVADQINGGHLDSEHKVRKRNTDNKFGTGENDPVPQCVPSIIELKKTLPKHCFESKLSLSFYYVAKDLSIVTLLYLSMCAVEMLPWNILTVIYAPIYWFFQGTMMWAIFVLGHDCGHGSFSKNDLLNDTVGTFLHTLIFVPFYPWKLSHKHHHRHTGDIDQDEIFYPVRESQDDGKPFAPYFCFGAGWWVYLTRGFHPRRCQHFNPFDSLFVNHVLGCTLSIASLGVWSLLLCKYYSTYGLLALASHYIAPAAVFATWLVVVTFLHHADVNVPWYSKDKWDNVRGQLSSVDRDYGWAHHLTHNIGTHQIHHLFIKIPHYHLEEATRTFRATYPNLVRKSSDSIIPSYFRMFNIYERQRHIKDDTQVHWMKPE